MLRNASDVRSDAFDFIDNIQSLSTTGEIMEAMRTILGRVGIQFFCFYFLPSPKQNFEDVLLADRLPAGWLELYVEKQFVHADPSVRYGKRMVRPYRWFKEAPYDPEQEPGAIEVVQRAMDFGMLDGFVFPVAAPTSRVGHVWMGGQALDLAALDLRGLHLSSLYAFDRVLRLHLQIPNGKPNLTPREREVLTWVALGKTAWEIGEILKISERTIHYHVANVLRKLNAANCAQAVMIGLRDQIIQP